MKYIRVFAALAAMVCLLCACKPDTPPLEQPSTQIGTQYGSTWTTGISKEAASKNKAVADWLELCSDSERDDIGHYVLRNTVENGDGTTTHHLLLYRSATEHDAKSFTVSFTEDGELLVVTPTYTSAEQSEYGYDLIYLCLTADSDVRVLVELLVDGDYPGQIITTVKDAITPDTFGVQSNE